MPEIRSLTGLRFWAAFSIVLHHLLLGIIPRGTSLETMLVACGSLGMTTFFILSGFIIHYNYHNKIRDFSRRSLWEFFVARLSRLYPLYVVLMLVDFAMFRSAFGWSGKLLVLPYFLTLSQSWFYMAAPNGGLLPFIFPRASIAWSISTEMLMYSAYPVILMVLLRDRTDSARRIAWIATGILSVSVVLAYLNEHRDLIDRLAIGAFRKLAEPIGPYPFSIWLTFYSPYLRIFEFLIGALTAHLLISRRDTMVSLIESRMVHVLAVASLFMIASTFVPKANQTASLSMFFASTGYYPWIAALMYACARLEGSWVDRFFSWKPFVQLGEWSYSIYLFHIFIYHAVSATSVDPSMLVVRALATVVTVFVCAFLLYTFVEMPGRKRMRSWLMSWQIGLPRPETTVG
jgi:peptidoglycan/LPS O-acetylase OafA/YrhL